MNVLQFCQPCLLRPIFKVAWVLTLPLLLHCAHRKHIDHSQAQLHYDLGVEHIAQGHHRLALKALLQSIEKDPSFAASHNALGLTYHYLGQHTQAQQAYQQALKLNPQLSEAKNGLGILLLDIQQPQAAVPWFHEAASDLLYSAASLARGNLGWAYYQLGEINLAVEHLAQAVSDQPRFCRGYTWLATIAQDNDDAALLRSAATGFENYCTSEEVTDSSIDLSHLHRMKYFLGLTYVQAKKPTLAYQAFTECADSRTSFGQACIDAAENHRASFVKE